MNNIVSVNVGQPIAVKVTGADGVEHLVVSGIFKSPIDGPVVVRKWGLAGDGQADTRVTKGGQVHGGASKAVYLYPVAHYARWQAELGRELPFGQFGENLTYEGPLEDEVRIGDVLRVGDHVLLRVTDPRGPCYKLDIRMGIPEFKQRMVVTGWTGFYASVESEGEIVAGNCIERIETDVQQPTVLDAHRAHYGVGSASP
jgi:MOSC domain-containing protein YiiM